MSAALLADALRALVPFAKEGDRFGARDDAREVLRKAAPCEVCDGKGHFRLHADPSRHTQCEPCSGAGWTHASIEAAIARAAERERLDAAVIAAVERVRATQTIPCRHEERTLAAAVDARRKALATEQASDRGDAAGVELRGLRSAEEIAAEMVPEPQPVVGGATARALSIGGLHIAFEIQSRAENQVRDLRGIIAGLVERVRAERT